MTYIIDIISISTQVIIMCQFSISNLINIFELLFECEFRNGMITTKASFVQESF